MPSIRYNPFRPFHIATTGMFSGRMEEMEAIEKSLFQTKNENPKHFLFEGERGIGKSSIMFAAELLANGDMTPFLSSSKYNFLVVSFDLSITSDGLNLIERVGIEFKNAVSRSSKITATALQAWDFIKNWKAFGVEYKSEIQV